MWNKPINIGFGSVALCERIVTVAGVDSAPIKRLITDAKERKILIDVTHGRRARAAIFTDSNYIILSAITPETIAARITEDKNGNKERENG